MFDLISVPSTSKTAVILAFVLLKESFSHIGNECLCSIKFIYRRPNLQCDCIWREDLYGVIMVKWGNKGGILIQ